MKVSDLHQHPQLLFAAQAEEKLDEAVDRMHWHQVGALPVMQNGRLVGVLSIRDLLGAEPSS